MDDLISREALRKRAVECGKLAKQDPHLLVVGLGYVIEAPAVDAAPVVTCGMCRYHKPIDFCELHRQTGWFNDQFCSRGARMNLPEGEMT